MFQNYEILFAVGTLGAIISLILLLIALLKNSKIIKVISILLITVFVITFSTGIGLGYFYYEHSKDILNKVNIDEASPKAATVQIEETKITSGNIHDPVVITEKNLSADDDYYYSEFEIKNNTNIEISKISFHIVFTYKYKQGDITKDEHVFLLDSIIPPNKSVQKNYIWKKDLIDKKLSVTSVKLTKIHDITCYVNINGEEKSMKLDDLKAIANKTK